MWLVHGGQKTADITPRVYSLAASVLFDGTLTFAALLGVALDPVCRFAVVLALFDPELGNLANEGSVIAIECTAKAK